MEFRLTGNQASDHRDACTTYLYDIEKRTWSPSLVQVLGLDQQILPEIKRPIDLVGTITRECSAETGLLTGTPVAVGAGDFPGTLRGSGVSRVGVGSASTVTSTR